MENHIKTENASISVIRESLKKHAEDELEIEENIAEKKEVLEKLGLSLKEKSDEVFEIKRDIKTFVKEMELNNLNASIAEADLEKMSSEKLAIFRRCQLEEIKLPIMKNSATLEDVIFEQDVSFE